jgi:hypothetical protein
MNELIAHLQDEKFLTLKGRLKACVNVAEQRKLLEMLDDRRLAEFTAWLLNDGNVVAALHMVAINVAQRRQFAV